MRQAYQLEWASKDLGQESRVALGDVNGDGRINIIAGTTAASGHQSNLRISIPRQYLPSAGPNFPGKQRYSLALLS